MSSLKLYTKQFLVKDVQAPVDMCKVWGYDLKDITQEFLHFPQFTKPCRFPNMFPSLIIKLSEYSVVLLGTSMTSDNRKVTGGKRLK